MRDKRPHREDTHRPKWRRLAQYEGQIALTFSVFLFILALIVSILGGLFHLRDVNRERALFTEVIASTLDRSINALNFGGTYQIRRFVNETVKTSPTLAYLYIVGADGRFIAHSEAGFNGQMAPEGLLLMNEAESSTTQRPYRGRSVTEIITRLRGGFEGAQIGAVYVGIYTTPPRALLMAMIIRTVLIFLGLMLLGLPIVFLLSLRLAAPMRRLASILQGVLERAPVMVAVFDEAGEVEARSDLLASTLSGEATADLRPRVAAFEGRAQEMEVMCGEARRVWSTIFFSLRRGHCLIARDVTEEKQLTRENQQLAAAVAAADDQVIVTDHKGIITYINPAFIECTGFSREDLVGMTPALLNGSEASHARYQTLWKEVRAGHTWRGRVINRRKDGTLYDCDLVVSPIFQDTQITNFVSIGRDRTRELKLEEQLLHAQRMDAVGRLAGGIAHDFNNLLSVINGHSELLLLGGALPDEITQDIKTIASAGRRAAELTQQLLAFSRRQPRNLETLALREIVTEMIDMISSILSHDIHFEHKIPDEAPWLIRADRGQLEQVLLNLCINARDAMPLGGRLLIEVEHETFTASDMEAPPGDYAALSISDTGEGIPAELREQIFEPFFTTKPLGQGTGLGLSMVHGVLKQSGGFIWVYSEVGIGTTFKLIFPRVDGGELCDNPLSSATRLQALPPTGTEHILVVEDQPSVRQTIVKILHQAGYQIDEAEHGRAALDLLEGGLRPDLILSDLSMPQMGGLEMAKEIRARFPALRLAFMSGYSAHIAKNNEALGDALFILRKPPTVRLLREQVRLALDQPKSL
ncbi:PAS domain S-box protein [Myxococcota bacterium]|nr:PAS domain S-box protein [Myxococcota bacterium]MBU1430019.1 PAS domain S-box protein [Myxococcota bacterium]MBU1899858.1 PAS domain S-box protein [Myxococcota bacterium]